VETLARPQVGTRWALVDSRAGRESVRWGHAEHARELPDVPLDGSAGEPSDSAVFAACAHGRHDQCGAVARDHTRDRF
jgi:hypothetical protein